MTQYGSPKERLEDQLVKQGKCMVFTGTTLKNGYGQIRSGFKKMYAHRLAYELYKGKIPTGKVVRHTCDNPPCCNPDHLILGTYLDNNRDSIERGRDSRGTKVKSAKLNDDLVREIRKKYSTGKYTQKQLSVEYGITPANIGRVVNNKSWTHVK